MDATSPRWQAITDSGFPWERDALAFVRDRLPNQDPYRAWSNFEFIADDGSINEVDLLVLTPKGFYLVEIKSLPGVVEGEQGTWAWRYDGRRHTVDNPLLLANRKAKKLISLLRRQAAFQRKASTPFVEAHVFLSREAVDCRIAQDLQRREDAIDARTKLPASHPEHLTPEAAAALKEAESGAIPVPPRYASAGFRKGIWWRLRGKLDVPKERFVSLPFCEREAAPSLVIGWAGWNALERSRAVAAYFHQMREQEGWAAARLTPLIAALLELLPWMRQYHNAPDPEFDTRMGDYFEGFIDEEARALLLTRETVRAWTPPAGRRRLGDGRRSSEVGA